MTEYRNGFLGDYNWLQNKSNKELIEIIKTQQKQIRELEKIVSEKTDIIPSYISCA